MRIELCFGDGTQTVAIPDENYMGSLLPNAVEPGPAGDEAVRRALAEPIGSPPLRSLARPGERIAIVTSDITRPMPTARVMPALLEELYAAGVSPGDITLVFALGSHRKHTQQERAALAGP
jgi:nickel-dependent lactate racemase